MAGGQTSKKYTEAWADIRKNTEGILVHLRHSERCLEKILTVAESSKPEDLEVLLQYVRIANVAVQDLTEALKGAVNVSDILVSLKRDADEAQGEGD